MKYKYENCQIWLHISLFIHIVLGILILAIMADGQLSIVIDILLGICWVAVALIASVLNHWLDDKIKETKINNLNKQMRK